MTCNTMTSWVIKKKRQTKKRRNNTHKKIWERERRSWRVFQAFLCASYFDSFSEMRRRRSWLLIKMKMQFLRLTFLQIHEQRTVHKKSKPAVSLIKANPNSELCGTTTLKSQLFCEVHRKGGKEKKARKIMWWWYRCATSWIAKRLGLLI